MGLSLKKLFKKKEGGTDVGNLFRKVTHGLADKVGLGEVVDMLNPVPGAPAKVQETAKQTLTYVTQLPALSFSAAEQVAKQAETKIINAGGTQEEAQTVAQQVQSIAQEPAKVVAPEPAKPKATVAVNLKDLDATLAASKALGTDLASTPQAVEEIAKKKGMTKAQVLDIFKDGLVAAKDQMVQSWLDKTDSGKDTKYAAIWAQVEKYAPYVVGIAILYAFLKKQGIIK